MPRSIATGKQAQYKHGGVQYYPFQPEPGTSLVLTSEPWAYLQAHLKNVAASSRSDKKKRYQRALYYSELAEEFQLAAKSARLPAKATLAYYGVLNLAKCFICVKGKHLGDKIEHHGLSPSSKHGYDIGVTKRGSNHINIFHEFVEALGSPAPTKQDVKFSECLLHIPEVHEVSYRLGLLPGNQRNLLPVDISILTDVEEAWLFTETTYWKKSNSRFKVDKFLKGTRNAYFREGREEDNRVVFRSKRRKRLVWNSYKRIYQNICKDYSKLGVATLLTREGYKYYCDLEHANYHHFAYSFMALFYLGTVTRYNPAKTQALMDGKFRPVISELISLSPDQFVYQLISHITETICVVPYSKL